MNRSNEASSSFINDESFENITKLENEMQIDESPTLAPAKTKSRGRNVSKPVSLNNTVEAITDIEADDIISSTANHPKDTSTMSTTDRSFLSLIYYQNTVGAAYYDTEHCVLNIFKQTSETESCSNSLKICFQANPDKIIVNAKQKSKLVDILNEEYFSEGDSGVEVVASSFFVYELAKQRLLNLSPSSQIHSGASDNHKDIWINSLVNMEDKNSIKAAGALLRYIDQNRIGIELEDSFIQAPILTVAQVSILSSLYLDNNTLLALQIFQSESHPSSAKRGLHSSNKEGLSLFGEMNRTKSRMGSVKLRHWFLTPSRDVNVIEQRQDAIKYFSLNENLDKVLAMYDCLKNIKSLTKIIAKMTSSHISVHDWSVLYKTLYNLVCLMDLCNAMESDIEIIELIQSTDYIGLRELLATINKIMDFEESKVKNRFVVKYGIDKELDEKKRVFNGLPDLMTKVAEQELAGLDSQVLECNVIYLPQLGYLLTIPHYPFIKEENNYALQDFEFMFVNNDMVHYKSGHTKELDRLLGDTQSEICDHESGIMHRLQNMILQYVDLILKCLEFAATLDCLLSIASFSKENNLVFPNIITDKRIDINGGRHILYEMCSRQFVCNDTYFNSDEGFMKVISGPNACGKSLYLKQIALIVFMAHIGAPVPARQADICVCDSIFTRIRCIESISINLSTFVLDLNQITKAVNCASDRSLVVIDEFGKGTSQHDGIALFTSILKYWLSKNETCPFVVAATHFHSIFKLKLLPPSPFLKYKTFDMAQDEKGVIYLYKLIDGYSLHSHANHVARVAGLDESIIQRAEHILSLTAMQKPIVSIWKCDEHHASIVEQFISTDFTSLESTSVFKTFVESLQN